MSKAPQFQKLTAPTQAKRSPSKTANFMFRIIR